MFGIAAPDSRPHVKRKNVTLGVDLSSSGLTCQNCGTRGTLFISGFVTRLHGLNSGIRAELCSIKQDFPPPQKTLKITQTEDDFGFQKALRYNKNNTQITW